MQHTFELIDRGGFSAAIAGSLKLCRSTTQNTQPRLAGKPRNKQELVALLEGLGSRGRQQATMEELSIVEELYALQLAGGRLDNVPSNSGVGVHEFLKETVRTYQVALGQETASDHQECLVTLLSKIRRLRKQSAKVNTPYLLHDGATGIRSERLLPKTETAERVIGEPVLRFLEQRLPFGISDAKRLRDVTFRQLMREALLAGGPDLLLKPLLAWIVHFGLPCLSMTSLVGPRRLSSPENWSEDRDGYFCYVSIHSEFEPSGLMLNGVPVLSHSNIQQVVISRMTNNKARITSRRQPGEVWHRQEPQPGDIGVHQGLEKERGHAASGVSSAIKLKIPLVAQGGEGFYWEQADVRLIRHPKAPASWSSDEISAAVRYRDWIGECMNEMYLSSAPIPSK